MVIFRPEGEILFAHRTRPFAVAAASLAVTALVLTGCSSDGDQPAEESSAAAASSTENAEGTGNAFGEDQSLVDSLLTQDDAPEGSTVEPVAEEMVTTYVQGRQDIREAETIFGDACDDVLRGDFASDHLLTDGAINKVSFGEGQNAIMVVLAPGRLDDFLDEGSFTCESGEITQNQVPGVESQNQEVSVRMTMSTEPGPQVEGAESFTETRDVIKSNASGGYHMQRNVIIHGYAGDTTIDVSYTGETGDPNADPITPEIRERLAAVFTAQAEKLQG